MISLRRLVCFAQTPIQVFIAGLLTLVVAACGGSDSIESIRQMQAAGDYVGTLDRLREWVVERPTDAEANYLYGRALVSTGQASLATWPLRQAMQDPEWLVSAGTQLAHAALISGDFNEVVDVTTRILEDHPDNSVALLFRAQAQAHWKKDPAAALEDAERVLELTPDAVEAYEPRILALLALGRQAEASEVLAEAGQRLDEIGAARSSLAWHCSTTAIFAAEGGKVDEARKVWGDCLEKFPGDPTVVSNAVKFFDANHDWPRSLEVLRDAFAEAPTERHFRIGLADRLRAMGKSTEAEELLQAATREDDPRRAAVAWTDLAHFRNSASDHAAAAEALARAIELMPSEEDPGTQLLFQYADVLVLAGQLDRALEVAEDIAVPAQRRLIRARVAQERGDPARALEEFDEALRLWPNNAQSRYYAALAAERLGDFDRALEEYRYSIRVSVGATDARTRVARMLLAGGQPLLAYQLLFLEVANAPLEPEGELLSMYLMARVANPAQLQSSLAELAVRKPAMLPAALVQGAEGAADAVGPRAALGLLRGAPGIDYTHPRSAPVLRALVRFASLAGDPDLARSVVDAALAAHPESDVFQELLGLHLELEGVDLAGARAAYQQALKIEPDNAGALAGLGRLSLPLDPADAVVLFDRAVAADPSDSGSELAAARALRVLGRVDEAQMRLEALLDRHPFEHEAATELVSLDLEAGVATARTLARARQAARFGGGAAAYERLSEIYTRLDRLEEASQAATRARLLQERPSSSEARARS